MQLKKGDKVNLLPTKELLELFEAQNFFSVNFRKEAAEKLGDKEGIVENIEEKYAKDYFFFLPNDSNNTWSIPVSSVSIKL